MFDKKISASRAMLTHYSLMICAANDTRFRCEYCPRSYATSGNRNRHMETYAHNPEHIALNEASQSQIGASAAAAGEITE